MAHQSDTDPPRRTDFQSVPPSGPGGAAESPRITRAQWLVLAAACLGWMFDGVEIGLPPIMGRPALMDLLGPEMAKHENIAPLLGVLGAVFLVGAAAGGIVFGWLGDRFGRVRTMIFSVLTYSPLRARPTGPPFLGT